MALFTVGEAATHQMGHRDCPECWENYPEPCRCGGLMHAAGTADEDPDGNAVLVTRCDRCGRNEDDLDNV